MNLLLIKIEMSSTERSPKLWVCLCWRSCVPNSRAQGQNKSPAAAVSLQARSAKSLLPPRDIWVMDEVMGFETGANSYALDVTASVKHSNEVLCSSVNTAASEKKNKHWLLGKKNQPKT